ncbi:SH3 domain-containing protein [Gilbertella persicaria]|uniref:SH3 domain-containing protein n=1 Tax=Gilbertella persicaria TaxID=101096 RepID=UPI00221F549F|nr:SH3 domain-containing protein [Gilbertella persicaria]KAI8063410.1 SH3 domain-containing protein [Gilbertella persicaria]
MTAELYKVLFDYETDKDDELAVKEGDTIRVTSKDSPEWWFAETLDSNASGLVPSNFIEKMKTEEGHLAIVIQDYTAQSSDELSLQSNGIVTVLDTHAAEGWWKGDLNGKKGVFPASHVQLLEEEEDGKSKNNFKLAAYGVKQGGIGSILAGGLSLKRSSTVGGHRTSMNEKRTSQASESQVPMKPHPIKMDSTTPASSVKALSCLKAMVIHDYKPENQDEIQLMRGEYVTVIDKMENDGWWKGTSENGATGIFPSNFVQVVDDEKPTRPVRARPATVKTETNDSMAKPPPVPVGTRPMSLLTQRDTISPPSRPTTLPPRPNITSSTRRPSEKNGHKRIPSIPLVSPDLPPLSPIYDQRPTRPIPRPTSMDAPTSPPPARPLPSMSPEAHMAKPPKVNLANLAGPVAPPRSPSTSRPCSLNHEAVPPVPKRSMPPVPENKPTETPHNDTQPSLPDNVRQMILIETEKIRVEFEAKLEEERIQRMKLQTELEELRARLN